MRPANRLFFGREGYLGLRGPRAFKRQRYREPLAAESLTRYAQRPQPQLRALAAPEFDRAHRDAALLDLVDDTLDGALVFLAVRDQHQTRYAPWRKRRRSRAKRLLKICPGSKRR